MGYPYTQPTNLYWKSFSQENGAKLNNYFESLRSNVISSIYSGPPPSHPHQHTNQQLRMPTEPDASVLAAAAAAAAVSTTAADPVSAGQFDNYLSKLQNICSTNAEAKTGESMGMPYDHMKHSFAPLPTRI